MLILSIINIRQIRMLRFIPRRELRQFCSKFFIRLSTIFTPISILFHTFAFNHLMPPKLRFLLKPPRKKIRICNYQQITQCRYRQYTLYALCPLLITKSSSSKRVSMVLKAHSCTLVSSQLFSYGAEAIL